MFDIQIRLLEIRKPLSKELRYFFGNLFLICGKSQMILVIYTYILCLLFTKEESCDTTYSVLQKYLNFNGLNIYEDVIHSLV